MRCGKCCGRVFSTGADGGAAGGSAAARGTVMIAVAAVKAVDNTLMKPAIFAWNLTGCLRHVTGMALPADGNIALTFDPLHNSPPPEFATAFRAFVADEKTGEEAQA